MHPEDPKDSLPDDGKPKERRPYEKPAFKHERVLETMALSCGKIAGTSVGCDLVPKFS